MYVQCLASSVPNYLYAWLPSMFCGRAFSMIFLEILIYAFLGAVVKVATETLLITYTLVSYGGSNTFHDNMLISPLCLDCTCRIQRKFCLEPWHRGPIIIRTKNIKLNLTPFWIRCMTIRPT